MFGYSLRMTVSVFVFFFRKNIGPGEECRETVTLKARRAGRQEIVANFYCRQICDVAGAAELDISEDSKN